MVPSTWRGVRFPPITCTWEAAYPDCPVPLCVRQVLSDTMVLAEEDGGLSLMLRVGDTYPNQILDPIVRAYLYRWPGHPANSSPDYTVSH